MGELEILYFQPFALQFGGSGFFGWHDGPAFFVIAQILNLNRAAFKFPLQDFLRFRQGI